MESRYMQKKIQNIVIFKRKAVFMYKYFIYFEKKDPKDVLSNGINYGYVKTSGNVITKFVKTRYEVTKPFDTEEKCRDTIKNLRKNSEYAGYKFSVVRDNSYLLAHVNETVEV